MTIASKMQPQPRKNKPNKYHKQNAIEHGLVRSEVAMSKSIQGRGITG